MRCRRYTRKERGFTLLEYCAGAAVVAAVIWGAFYALGSDIRQFMGDIGAWAKARGSEVASTTAPAGDTTTGR